MHLSPDTLLHSGARAERRASFCSLFLAGYLHKARQKRERPLRAFGDHPPGLRKIRHALALHPRALCRPLFQRLEKKPMKSCKILPAPFRRPAHFHPKRYALPRHFTKRHRAAHRAEHDVTWARASVIKAYYSKNEDPLCPKEVLTVSVNKESTNIPSTISAACSPFWSARRKPQIPTSTPPSKTAFLTPLPLRRALSSPRSSI